MIDGWIIEADVAGWLGLWLVKGYEHPEGYVIAVPYRTVQPTWTPVRFVGCVGRRVPLVSRKEVIKVFDPFLTFKLRRDEIPDEIKELLDWLDVESVGITGSWAVFSESRDSDIDLLVFSKRPREIYARMFELKLKGLISQCRSYDQMLRKVRSRWIVESYLSERLLESCYKGRPYTLRVLRYLEERPCSHRLQPLGRARSMSVKIVDNSESFMVPARYVVRVVKAASWITDLNRHYSRIVLETWRTRYQELSLGVYDLQDVYVLSNNSEVILAVDPQGQIRKTASRSYDTH